MKQLLLLLTLCMFLLASGVATQQALALSSCCDVAGDANNDDAVNLLDITFLINYLYKAGAAPECMSEGDANADGAVNLLDITYLINYLYKAGSNPNCAPWSGIIFDDEYGSGITYEAFDGSLLDAVQISADVSYIGDQSLEITIPGDAPYWSGGAFTDSAECDASGFNAITFYAKASQEATLDVAGLGNDNTGNSKYMAEVSSLPLTTEWQLFVIPIPLPEKLTAEDGHLYFAEGEGVTYQIWMDEIKYDNLATITNPRPAITTQTLEVTAGDNIDPGWGTVTFDVDGTDIDVSTMPGYFTFSSSNEAVVTVGPDGTITAVGEGTAELTAVLGSDKSIPAIGVITVNVSPAEPVPVVSAPTPTVPSDSVISIYSDAYTDHPVDTYLASWSVANIEDFVIESDSTKKYSGLSYAGIEFTTTTVDASSMTHFHIDVWTPKEVAGKTFNVKLVDFGADGAYGGGDDVEHELAFDDNTMVSESWVSIDVPLSSFTSLVTKSHLAQIVIAGSITTVYLDNIYFYESGVPVEPLIPAPTPTINSANVVSLYSDAYTPATTVDTWLAGWSSSGTTVEDFVVASDNSKKYSALQWAGVVFESSPLDASTMTHFHMDVWTPDPTDAPSEFRVKLVDFGADGVYGGGDDVEHELTFDENTMNTSEWVGIDVPLSDFTNLTTTGHLAQMVISSDPNTVFIDNIYFYVPPPSEPQTSAPTPSQDPGSVFSVFSDTYTSVPFDVWSPEWDFGDIIDTVVGSDPIKKFVHWGETWVLSEYTVGVTGPQDISTMTHFHMDVWTPDVTDGSSQYKIKLVDFGPDGVYGTDDTEHELILTNAEMSSNNWVSLDIPLADFTGLTTREHFAQLVISGTYETVFVDNIYFYDAGTPAEPTTSAPTPSHSETNVFSIFSNAYTTNTEFDVWSFEWDNGNVTDFTIGSDNLKKFVFFAPYYYNVSELTSTGPGPQDISDMTHLHINVWTPDVTDGSSEFKIKLVDYGADGAYGGGDDSEHELTYGQGTMSTGAWVSFDISLDDFTNLTGREHFAQMVLSGNYGTVFVDNVYFHK